MSRFWEDAVRVFETASQAPRDDASGDLGILIDTSGGLRIVMAEGWSPESLQSHYGAGTVYCVSQKAGGVRVEGRGQGVSCVLRSQKPAAAFAPLPAGLPLYEVVCSRLLA